jgi:hypothetical protein
MRHVSLLSVHPNPASGRPAHIARRLAHHPGVRPRRAFDRPARIGRNLRRFPRLPRLWGPRIRISPIRPRKRRLQVTSTFSCHLHGPACGTRPVKRSGYNRSPQRMFPTEAPLRANEVNNYCRVLRATTRCAVSTQKKHRCDANRRSHALKRGPDRCRSLLERHRLR